MYKMSKKSGLHVAQLINLKILWMDETVYFYGTHIFLPFLN